MTKDFPSQGLRRAFSAETVEIVIDALSCAYESAADHFEPDRGSNEKTFGFDLYHCATFELTKAAEDEATNIQLESRDPIFRLAIGDFAVACHRVGRSGNENIWTSFPNNDGAAAGLVEEQLWLPGMEFAGLETARTAVIAHMGNAEDGLCAIYVCVPSRTNGARITGWASATLLWKRDENANRQPSPAIDLAPEEAIVRPTITKRVRKKSDEGNL